MILHFSKAILLLSGIQLLSRKPPQSPPSQPGLFSADNISILRTQPMDEGSENPRYTSLTEMKMKIAAIVLRLHCFKWLKSRVISNLGKPVVWQHSPRSPFHIVI
ncbi:PREDICTED: uncharacterized protein LOC109180555 isoform X3 [Ipomoea nil]|uniref:uncharacterized protein LOC109180555 isoform X3 n=1 Tax=Ipomoea nil TaxID=35883 RepID=UPI000901ED4C|nr:PREDICTED: uncharacterized protein LOC109180555 isoform X3 [Ipomoea nil]